MKRFTVFTSTHQYDMDAITPNTLDIFESDATIQIADNTVIDSRYGVDYAVRFFSGPIAAAPRDTAVWMCSGITFFHKAHGAVVTGIFPPISENEREIIAMMPCDR